MNYSTSQRSLCVVVLLLISITAIVNSAPNLTSDNLSAGEVTISPPPLEETGLLEQQRGKGSKMLRRMILPLLIGVLLKVSSLLPVILGKFALMAFGSLMTSKLALVIAGVLIIHKFHSEHSWSPFTTGHSAEAQDPYYSYSYRRRG